MIRRIIIILFVTFLTACVQLLTKESEQIPLAFKNAELQTEKMLKEIIEQKGQNSKLSKENYQGLFPGSLNEDGSLKLIPSRDWRSGFFSGELWFLYEYTMDEKWKDQAEKYTSLIEQEKFNTKDRGIGFKMMCSFGKGYEMTKNEAYRDILIQSANSLLTCFNENVGCIKSCDTEHWQFPVIIDNMMDLELLFWASKETGDPVYYNIAVKHAYTTLKNHFRHDHSSYHVVSYDTISGDVLKKQTKQGYSDESAWARGQAWGLYGFTMTYRETGAGIYYQQAEKIAHFILNHSNLPNDMIPFWDYDAPEIPNESRDVSAAAITASALYELSTLGPEKNVEYSHAADKIMKHLFVKYKSKDGQNKGFILDNSTGNKPENFEVNVPLIYADYYYMEALSRKYKFLQESNAYNNNN
ncbi:MAG: glycoside hydrolase family 88 protein [Bacteroidales bacterium]|nr:glycoside hydrolase family 88 protein [Bacteroidales bacterium]